MTINLKGLYTPPPPEDRNIAYLDISYNGNHYDWMAYVPVGVDVGQHLQSVEQSIYADIDRKEAQWSSLTPKTRSVFDLDTNQEIVVDIQKEEIVKPDYPDYYAKRRAEYPSLADQIGALINQNSSPSFTEIQAKIAAVKSKYPKSA
jgi:hypothetical protein